MFEAAVSRVVSNEGGRQMKNRKRVLTALAVAAVVGALGVSAQAAWISRVNHLTFSGSVALPGVVLPAGSYTFEAAPPSGGLDVVRVITRDGKRVMFQGFTNAVMRPAGLGPNDLVTFGEKAPGQPAPIDTWYPVGSSTGRRFIYR
jgi:hypothetical protein